MYIREGGETLKYHFNESFDSLIYTQNTFLIAILIAFKLNCVPIKQSLSFYYYLNCVTLYLANITHGKTFLFIPQMLQNIQMFI